MAGRFSKGDWGDFGAGTQKTSRRWVEETERRHSLVRQGVPGEWVKCREAQAQ